MTRRNFFKLAAAAGLALHAKGLYAHPGIIATKGNQFATTDFSLDCLAPGGAFLRLFNDHELILAAELPPQDGQQHYSWTFDPPLMLEDGLRLEIDGIAVFTFYNFTARSVEL